MTSRFEDVRKKWFGHDESKKKMDKHRKNKEQKKMPDDKKNTGGERFPGKPLTESVEDRKKSYKQTKSSRREFGPRTHVEDSAGVRKDSSGVRSELDGFFEDNRRSWRQRVRGIGAHMERLNDELFMSMDDDDVENIVEDLKDIGGDLEQRDVSEDVRTWMSCQLRWWKTRIHRKHRAEDLVKGCGRQLVHWQLRVLCKDIGVPQEHPPCDAVRSHRQPYDVLLSGRRAGVEEDVSGMENETWSSVVDWYFGRAQDREDRRRLSPQWYFDRADERHVSRGDASWYVRAMRRRSADVSPAAGPPRRQKDACPGV